METWIIFYHSPPPPPISNLVFYGVQLSKHFTYSNTPWSQRIQVTDFLLYLYAYRKVCKNCLCQREEHDIKVYSKGDTGTSVGKLLFSPSVDTLKKIGSSNLRLPPGVEFVSSPSYVFEWAY